MTDSKWTRRSPYESCLCRFEKALAVTIEFMVNTNTNQPYIMYVRLLCKTEGTLNHRLPKCLVVDLYQRLVPDQCFKLKDRSAAESVCVIHISAH